MNAGYHNVWQTLIAMAALTGMGFANVMMSTSGLLLKENASRVIALRIHIAMEPIMEMEFVLVTRAING